MDILTATTTLNDGTNALKLEFNGAGGATVGAVGAGLVFSQGWNPPSETVSLVRVAGIYGVKNGPAGNFGGALALYTQPNSGADMVERMRIDMSGRVGIGTTTPLSKMTLILTEGQSLTLSDVNENEATHETLRFFAPNATTNYAQIFAYKYGTGAVARNLVLNSPGGNVGIGTRSPAATLEVNGKVLGGGTADAWSVENTGGTMSTSWTTIPGLTKTFTLTRAALVQFNASGTQRSGADTCHTGYRFVVDDVARGDSSHGQRIFVSNFSYSWWTMWSFSDFANLAAGTHSISVQARESAGLTPCYVCVEVDASFHDYARGNLNIIAVYQ